MSRILVVDDEQSICWGLSRLARAMGLRVDAASSAEEGLALAAAARPDVLVLDVRLPGMDGLTAMKSFRQYIGDAPVIVITAFGDLATAVAAIEQGAFEYVVKPFELAEIRAALERALCQRPRSAPTTDIHVQDGLVGRTPVMQNVFKQLALAAHADAPVLLCGEMGVGKESAARAIHRHSRRGRGPFVAVRVAAADDAMAEAELFGHAAGAFAGVGGDRTGALVRAHGGTLFVDEVGQLPLALQAKLVGALDRGEVLPVGGDQPIAAVFRIIAAASCDLRELVQQGAFRRDLFVKLDTFAILLPPLRERRDDIALLARVFAAELGNAAVALSDELLAELARRPWYGNVRELRSAVEHAVVLARSGVVLPRHLPEPQPPLLGAAPSGPAGDAAPALEQAVAALAETLLDNPVAAGDVYERFLREVEPTLLATVLRRSGNRCAPAARVLGLHRTTLRRKLDQYGFNEGISSTESEG